MQLPTENEAESGCRFIANELVVDPRGADNLSQDARTIDLTPVFACMHTQPDSIHPPSRSG
jgi:hypothetical protein